MMMVGLTHFSSVCRSAFPQTRRHPSRRHRHDDADSPHRFERGHDQCRIGIVLKLHLRFVESHRHQARFEIVHHLFRGLITLLRVLRMDFRMMFSTL